ncbi:MAG TPA: alpha/beta fold hydrolase [Steroidobacteraceae bacterium]|jgi:pimeloyl-ACP methyl ester carboxylesterase|nr:alpha/beta fold hydrolase [Steroidobacteraceae bacterium]
MSTVVVYVHGLWLNGWEATWLRRRLSRQLKCATRRFTYPSVTADLNANARALGRFLAATPADTLHLVAHSLGGLVILDFFESVLSSGGLLQNGRPLPPGRIVLLGSPVRGSRSARRLAQLPFGKSMMGKTMDALLPTPGERHWRGGRDLGIIAGDLSLGMGRLLGAIDAPNDGTVLIEETRMMGALQHVTLRVSHSGMVFSAAVARQIAAFLSNGSFAP